MTKKRVIEISLKELLNSLNEESFELASGKKSLKRREIEELIEDDNLFPSEFDDERRLSAKKTALTMASAEFDDVGVERLPNGKLNILFGWESILAAKFSSV